MTTVDGNESTSTLTPTDQDQLCVDTFNYVKANFTANDIAKMECGFTDSQSQDPSSCTTKYQTCLSAAQANLQQFQYPATPDCTGFDAAVAKCNTTVAEYTKCLQQEVDAMKAMESDFPLCTQADATNAELAALGKMSSDCITLMQTCSLTFAPSSSSSSSGGNLDAGGGG